MRLKLITPTKLIIDKEINSITVPGIDGEITILPHHACLLLLLKEGIITIRNNDEEYLAIGGGYLETDGNTVQVLVSRAYKQSEIDQQLTEKALENARKVLSTVKDDKQRNEAASLLRRSIIELKLLRKKRHYPINRQS